MNPTFSTLVQRYPELSMALPALEAALALLIASFRAGGKLLICGNGGSAADSDHIVGELMKGFERPRPIPEALQQRLQAVDHERGSYLAGRLQRALPAISLVSQPALATAIANDTAADMVFAQQVLGYGQPGDVLLAISTSGKAANVLNALTVARALDLRTIGLSGRSGGQMGGLCDALICVPSERTLEVQERHLPIYHALCIALEQEFFA